MKQIKNPLVRFGMTAIIVRKNTNEVAGVQLLLLENFFSANRYLPSYIFRCNDELSEIVRRGVLC